MPDTALLDRFSGLKDPRQAWKVGYPLPEILLVVRCGIIAGAENFVEIERWANRKLVFAASPPGFRARRALARHAERRHECAADLPVLSVLLGLGGELARGRAGTERPRSDIVAIDGKTSRRAWRGAAHPLHLVSAWATRQRLVLGQEAVAAKGNEITAIPLLLDRLELTGALVTIDAIGCQTKIAEAIRAKGADYLLALRDHWPTLAEEVRLFFDTAPAAAFKMHDTTDGDHGRIEI